MITIAATSKGKKYRKIYDCVNGYTFTIEELLAFRARFDEAKDCRLEEAREVRLKPKVRPDYLNEAKAALYDEGFTSGQMRLLNLYQRRGLPPDTAVMLAYWSLKNSDTFEELRANVTLVTKECNERNKTS